MATPRLAELPPSQSGWVEIDTQRQRLRWWQGKEVNYECAISTGVAGVGQQEGSGQTPLSVRLSARACLIMRYFVVADGLAKYFRLNWRPITLSETGF